MVDQQLQAPLALILVHIQAVDELHGPLGQHGLAVRVDVIEGDRIE